MLSYQQLVEEPSDYFIAAPWEFEVFAQEAMNSIQKGVFGTMPSSFEKGSLLPRQILARILLTEITSDIETGIGMTLEGVKSLEHQFFDTSRYTVIQ